MPKRKTPARAAVAVAIVATLAAVAELAPRLLGVVDIPIYRPSSDFGYVPAPSQSGAFLHRNRWAYNAQSMGTPAPFTGGGVLLVGNSIVDGGDWLDQAQRLGPQLQSRIGRPVWPIAAGGWSFLNELAYLRDPSSNSTGSSDQVVFVLDAADFGPPKIWANSPDHPGHRPRSAAFYLFDRLILNRLFPLRDELGKSRRNWRQESDQFRRTNSKPILVVLYSRRGDNLRVVDGLEGAYPSQRIRAGPTSLTGTRFIRMRTEQGFWPDHRRLTLPPHFSLIHLLRPCMWFHS